MFSWKFQKAMRFIQAGPRYVSKHNMAINMGNKIKTRLEKKVGRLGRERQRARKRRMPNGSAYLDLENKIFNEISKKMIASFILIFFFSINTQTFQVYQRHKGTKREIVQTADIYYRAIHSSFFLLFSYIFFLLSCSLKGI